MSARPVVSVVTPFYNTATYLAECIESVLGQTFQDFEYILVDNQSTDGSGDIAASYARKDPRIRVIKTPEFFGQVPNYNFALAQISGESRYCKVVQADDWIFPNCLAEMVGLGLAHPEVAIISAYELNYKEVNGVGVHPSRQVISGREACRLWLIGGVYMFGSPTTLLYRADIVRARRPFYEEGRLHEDTEVVFEILADHPFGIVHQVLTYIRIRAESITGSAQQFAPDRLDRLILVKRFGPQYLTPEELAGALDQAEGAYYGGLIRQWLHRPGGKFWEYHKRGLANAGESLKPGRLVRHLGATLAEGLLPPALLAGLRRRAGK
jgi:glycosyltransferase involved in cell wall biosynthesis